MSKRLRRIKVATTLGPVTGRGNDLEKIVAAGANAARMNFPHGSPEGHKLRVDRVREIATKPGCHVTILGDLQGPKIRTSTFRESKVSLDVGDKSPLDANLGKSEGDKEEVGIDYKGLSADVISGGILLLDDGHVQLRVLEVQGMRVFTEVTVGGPLSNSKGINKLGGGPLAKTLTEKDKAGIITTVQVNVDYLAASFPRRDEDLSYARRLARDAGCDVKIVTKVECAGAVCDQNAMDDVILASDVVMVARGDLGVEIGNPELVDIQRALIRRARQLNRVIITAIQMMESMITNLVPICMEVMDVASTVLDGTGAVVLSAETAAGQYPAKAVTAMVHICLGAGKILSINISKRRPDVQFDNVEEVITMSAMYAANHLRGVTAIVAVTESGCTTLATSRISSGLPTSAMSRHEHTLSLTSLYRGVAPVHFNSEADDVVIASETVNLLCGKGYLISGDLVTVTQGDVMSTTGSTNTTRILAVEQRQRLM